MTETSTGLSATERAAVKQRAKELRDQEKAGKSREAGTASVLEAIAKLGDDDRSLAEGLHRVVGEVAPQLVPKTYYGFPGYANDEGKVVLFLKPSSKFKERYATFTFEDRSTLDDGDIWAVALAAHRWSPAVEKKVRELVKAATA